MATGSARRPHGAASDQTPIGPAKVGGPDRRAVPLWTTYAGLPVYVVRKPCSQGEIQLTSVALSHSKSPFLITVVVLV
jgi:hypothetical protein